MPPLLYSLITSPKLKSLNPNSQNFFQSFFLFKHIEIKCQKTARPRRGEREKKRKAVN